MVGGGKPLPGAPNQLSFTALRYHLSFVAYATACVCMRTPCMKAQAGLVLRWVMVQVTGGLCRQIYMVAVRLQLERVWGNPFLILMINQK